ncbi:ParA family protein [Halobacterium salinarum]|uniref:ParA family protein n=1 Tax=Halobacterium salinarum TaxID=2242 RepID=UPI0025551565|nr:ParA family protein [Halobacterium salinarum]MDL0134755.1 ParA family protein [Halobacterium salinarum]
MLTYTVYSESGGVGKTTLAANLADAHSQQGRDVLAIDLDPQQGSLTYLLGVDAPRDDDNADNIARHLIDRPNAPFDDLIHDTPFGFDLLPSHNMLESLPQLLNKAQEMADDLGDTFNRHDRLRQLLMDANVHEKYDVIIVDPPATAGPHLYNAVSATRSLVLPVEPTGKGLQSISGIEDIVTNLSTELGFDVGVLAVVPIGVGQTTNQDQYLTQIQDLGYDAPIILRNRASLFEGCWDEQCTAFHYVGYHRNRQRDYEVDTLDKLRNLAAHIEEVSD